MRSTCEAADSTRVRISLAKIGQAIADIGGRCGSKDFVTRRLLGIAARRFSEIDLDQVSIADLDRAFVAATVPIDERETCDQHACRYMARVLQLASHATAKAKINSTIREIRK